MPVSPLNPSKSRSADRGNGKATSRGGRWAWEPRGPRLNCHTVLSLGCASAAHGAQQAELHVWHILPCSCQRHSGASLQKVLHLLSQSLCILLEMQGSLPKGAVGREGEHGDCGSQCLERLCWLIPRQDYMPPAQNRTWKLEVWRSLSSGASLYRQGNWGPERRDCPLLQCLSVPGLAPEPGNRMPGRLRPQPSSFSPWNNYRSRGGCKYGTERPHVPFARCSPVAVSAIRPEGNSKPRKLT